MSKSIRVSDGIYELAASAHVGRSRSTRQRRTCTGAASIAARNAQLDDEVAPGLHSPESLFLLSRKQLKSARFVERAPVAAGTGW